ncbi:MAG: T9SS type A sorting domain-containing protein [Ferruginibacter sp.]
MKTLSPVVAKPLYSCRIIKASLLFNWFVLFILFVPAMVTAQEITVYPGTYFVTKGAASMIIDNASFKNNGAFVAGTGTVKFTGDVDTTTAFVSGCNRTIFHNLEVGKIANGLALKSSVGVQKVLNVSAGKLYTDSNLTMLSDATLTSRVDKVPAGCNIIGKVMVERYVPARRAWRLMTAPVTDAATIYNTWQNRGVYVAARGLLVSGPASGHGMDNSNNSSLKTFNTATQAFVETTNTYVAVSPTNHGSADNIGYFSFVRGDRDFNNFYPPNTNITTITAIGRLQTGTQTFTASSTAGAYTLIGNPYASAVDFATLSKNNILNRITVWDPSLNSVGGYVTLEDPENDGTYVKSVMGSSLTPIIQSAQAFFVETDINGPASLTFTEDDKTGVNNNFFLRPPQPAIATTTGSMAINLYLSEPGDKLILADGIYVAFGDAYRNEVTNEDAFKFTNVNENIGLLHFGKTLCIERRPSITPKDTLFLRLWKTTPRNYQVEFDAALLDFTMQPFIIDSYLNTSTPLSISGRTKINFSVTNNPASSNATRFKVIFKPLNLSTLPVTFTNISADRKEEIIAVGWKVENEIDVAKYEVEKSSDGANFLHIKTIEKTGANLSSDTYQCLDSNPADGDNFYRIKMIEQSGKEYYSSIVKVAAIKQTPGLIVYPNPIKGNNMHLQLKGVPSGKYQLKLIGIDGKVIYRSVLTVGNNNRTYKDVRIEKNTLQGIYQLELRGADDAIYREKVIFNN